MLNFSGRALPPEEVSNSGNGRGDVTKNAANVLNKRWQNSPGADLGRTVSALNFLSTACSGSDVGPSRRLFPGCPSSVLARCALPMDANDGFETIDPNRPQELGSMTTTTLIRAKSRCAVRTSRTNRETGRRHILGVARASTTNLGRTDDNDRDKRQEQGLRREGVSPVVLGPRCPGGHGALVV